MMYTWVLVALAIVSSACPTWAAGFDCAKASNPVERIICSDEELSAADEELSYTYQVLFSAAKDKEQVKNGQRAWLGKVRNRCADEACLASAYDNRLEELRKALRAIPSQTGQKFTSREYYFEKETTVFRGKAEPQAVAGKITACVKTSVAGGIAFIDFGVYFPDSGQTLTGGEVPAKVDPSGALEFNFIDGWLNRGKGSFAKKGDKYELTLESFEPAGNAPGSKILKQYGVYRLSPGKCKSGGI